MPSRRPSRGVPLPAAALIALALVIAPASAAARAPAAAQAPAAGDGSVGFHPRLAHRPAGIPGHLHGRLAELVGAALAGHLDPRSLAGMEVAGPPAGPAVAVSLSLAPIGGAAALTMLTSLGGRVANRSANHVEAYLPAAALARLASLDGIDEAAPIIRPVPMGSVGLGNVGEGVALHHADQWQAAGIVGAGVKVGIIGGG